jgi:hypothetical protein
VTLPTDPCPRGPGRSASLPRSARRARRRATERGHCRALPRGAEPRRRPAARGRSLCASSLHRCAAGSLAPLAGGGVAAGLNTWPPTNAAALASPSPRPGGGRGRLAEPPGRKRRCASSIAPRRHDADGHTHPCCSAFGAHPRRPLIGHSACGPWTPAARAVHVLPNGGPKNRASHRGFRSGREDAGMRWSGDAPMVGAPRSYIVVPMARTAIVLDGGRMPASAQPDRSCRRPAPEPPLWTRLASSLSAPAMPSTRHTSSSWPAGRPDRWPRSLLRLPVLRLHWMRSHAQWTRCAASSSASALLRVRWAVGDSATAPRSSTSASLQRATRSARHVVRSARPGRQSGHRRQIGDEPRSNRQAGRGEGLVSACRRPVALADTHERDTCRAAGRSRTTGGRDPDRHEPGMRRGRRRPAQLSCASRDGCVATRRSWSRWSRSSCVERSRRSLARRARATSSSRSFRLLYSIISFVSGVAGGSARGTKVATGRVDNRAGGAFGRHPLVMAALAQLRARRSGAS